MTESIDIIIGRISEAVGARTQRQLAEVLGISPARISDAKNKGSVPSEWLIKLSTDHDINPKWVLTGKGPKTIVQQQNKSVTAKNGSIAVGNNIAGNVTQGDKQFRNPDVLTLARLLDEFESPAAIKVMIKKYEKLREEMDL